MSARRYELIVFDWDGTLVDSPQHIVESLLAACTDIGVPVPPAERARYIIGLGLKDALEHLLPDLPASEYPRLADRYRHHYLAGDAKVVTFPGVAQGIAGLNAAGFLLGVATGKSRRGLDRALQDTGLAPLFHVSRCADEGFPKPHPEMLQVLMELLNVAPARTLMVGDTTHDLEMARNAGVPALAVTYGAHGAAELARMEPVACAASFNEVIGWLEANG